MTLGVRVAAWLTAAVVLSAAPRFDLNRLCPDREADPDLMRIDSGDETECPAERPPGAGVSTFDGRFKIWLLPAASAQLKADQVRYVFWIQSPAAGPACISTVARTLSSHEQPRRVWFRVRADAGACSDGLISLPIYRSSRSESSPDLRLVPGGQCFVPSNPFIGRAYCKDFQLQNLNPDADFELAQQSACVAGDDNPFRQCTVALEPKKRLIRASQTVRYDIDGQIDWPRLLAKLLKPSVPRLDMGINIAYSLQDGIPTVLNAVEVHMPVSWEPDLFLVTLFLAPFVIVGGFCRLVLIDKRTWREASGRMPWLLLVAVVVEVIFYYTNVSLGLFADLNLNPKQIPTVAIGGFLLGLGGENTINALRSLADRVREKLEAVFKAKPRTTPDSV